MLRLLVCDRFIGALDDVDASQWYDYTIRSSASEGCSCEPSQKQIDDYQVWRCTVLSVAFF